jgi:myo-inositol-1(or 4)-monophosphatase
MTVKHPTEEELDEIYAFAVQLGKDAGKLLLDAAQARFMGDDQSPQDISEKESAVDIVTKTDEGEPSAESRLPAEHNR